MELSKILEKELLKGRFWTHSKTLVSGCTPVSPGCKNCWASEMEYRFRNPYIGGLIDEKGFNGELIEHPERCADILPKSNRRKPRVWTYWNDVFHEEVSDDLRDQLFTLIDRSDDYHIICTKRPEIAVKYLQSKRGEWFPFDFKKLIIMVTMENQEMVGRRYNYVKDLFDMGWKTGALIEPMLSFVDFAQHENCLIWIICGPENGKGKRPFDGQWAMRLQEQAKAASIPFFYKAGLLNGKRYIETP